MNNIPVPAHTGVRDPWLAGIAAIATVVLLMAPRMTHAMQLMLAAVPVAALLAMRDRARFIPLPALSIAAAALGVYILANAAWAVDPREAYGKVAYYWLLLLSVHAGMQGLTLVDDRRLKMLGQGLLLGLATAAVILAIEVVAQQPLRRAVFNALPFMRGPPKILEIASNKVLAISAASLNRNIAVLCLMLWPAVLLLKASQANAAWPWKIAAAALFAITGIAIFASEHETSMLALIASAVAFVGMLVAAPLMRGLVLAGWLVATLLVVPLTASAYSNGFHKASWIPQTGRNRIILWGVTAAEMRKAPILGIGVGSTKELDELVADTAVKPADHSYPLRTGRHAHNIFMQTWYELGAIGALLLSALGATVWWTLRRLPANVQPYAYASFVAAVVIGAFSWGMWQTWFMAAYAIWALLLALAIEAMRRQTRAGGEVAQPLA